MRSGEAFVSQDALRRHVMEKLDPRGERITGSGEIVLTDTKVGVDCRSKRQRKRDRDGA